MLKGRLYLKVSSKYDSTVTASPYFVAYRLLNDVNKAKKFGKKKKKETIKDLFTLDQTLPTNMNSIIHWVLK